MSFLIPIYVLLESAEASESVKSHVVEQTDIYVAGAAVEQIE